MYLIVGTVGLVGLLFYAAILGGGLDPFLDLPSFAIVVGGAFFATLAMSRGKFNQETVSFFGNSALMLGWIGFLIGIQLFNDQTNFIKKLMDNKLLTIRAADNVVRILPPLNVKKKEIKLAITILKKVCSTYK